MAEPGDRQSVGKRVTREVSISRLEKQLLAKVYGLLVPIALTHCRLPRLSAENRGSRRLTGSTSRTKGVS
jgi:hypothetical protein